MKCDAHSFGAAELGHSF